MRRSFLYLVSRLLVSSGLEGWLRRYRHRRSDFRVFILEYHEIVHNDHAANEGGDEIPSRLFRQHLEYLRRNFHLASMSEAVSMLRSHEDLKADLAVISFDDGYRNNFELAYPALRAAGAPAIVFLTTGFLDGEELWFDFARRALKSASESPDRVSSALAGLLRSALRKWPLPRISEQTIDCLKYAPRAKLDRLLTDLRAADLNMPAPAIPLTWDQVREMQAQGIEMGCHTVTHPILSALEKSEQSLEIRLSRDRIAQETGVVPSNFAYPNGSARDFTVETISILQHAGFTAACTTRRGSNPVGTDLFRLKRIGIGPDPLSVLALRLSGILHAVRFPRYPT